MLSAANPSNTIVYFWPSPPTTLVNYARKRGFLTVREVINTFDATAKAILDDAYSRLGLQPHHGITEESISRDYEEMALHDYLFSPNPRVTESLVEAGLDRTKILQSSYGWSPASFASSTGERARKGFRALFVGSVGVRKGVPQLLMAWKKSGVEGELVLVGKVEPPLKPLVASYVNGQGVRFGGFDLNVGQYFKSADIFVFPSLEEGDPLVAYEAAGCGLPVVATPMGSANIIKHGVNGLVVAPHDVDGLAQAISSLANSPELRHRLAQRAAMDAQSYTYEKVGYERAKVLSGLLAGRV
jgi:glycosyltransferase involved in cell wall biosynthesis